MRVGTIPRSMRRSTLSPSEATFHRAPEKWSKVLYEFELIQNKLTRRSTMVPRRKYIATSMIYFPKLNLFFLLLNAQGN